VLTVLAIQVQLGPWNIVVAMVIATVKAGLVALYFMHLRYDKGFIRITFMASLLFLSLFLGFVLMDSREYQTDIQWHETVVK
jgi:cytochrome c oxidase subunit 4